MKYIMRVVLVVGLVVAGSAIVADVVFSWGFLSTALSSIGTQGLFVGLLTSGLVGALLSQEYWLTA